MSVETVPIVVAIAFDDTGEDVLREACRLAKWRDGVVLHIAHVLPGLNAGQQTLGSIREETEQLEAVPARMLNWVRERCAADQSLGNPKVVSHVRTGPPDEALVQLCVDVGAQLLVVGTHQRTGVKRLALGSVAETIIRHARCPVLVAHPTNYEGLVPTPKPDPICARCAATRAETDGAQQWCEQHSKPHLRLHVYDAVDVFPMGSERPGSL
jgi:universal stress protein A